MHKMQRNALSTPSTVHWICANAKDAAQCTEYSKYCALDLGPTEMQCASAISARAMSLGSRGSSCIRSSSTRGTACNAGCLFGNASGGTYILSYNTHSYCKNSRSVWKIAAVLARGRKQPGAALPVVEAIVAVVVQPVAWLHQSAKTVI